MNLRWYDTRGQSKGALTAEPRGSCVLVTMEGPVALSLQEMYEARMFLLRYWSAEA